MTVMSMIPHSVIPLPILRMASFTWQFCHRHNNHFKSIIAPLFNIERVCECVRVWVRTNPNTYFAIENIFHIKMERLYSSMYLFRVPQIIFASATRYFHFLWFEDNCSITILPFKTMLWKKEFTWLRDILFFGPGRYVPAYFRLC